MYVRAHAENRPGVYRMIGPAGELLYVGKSVRLRTRLLSYFRARRGEKAAEIIGHAHRIEWDYVPSEFRALLTELEEIKRWRPLFNVEHKRDRQFCFIKLARDAAPRLLLVGTVTPDGAYYFGPFRGRRRVRDALRELSDLLELRDCAATVPIRFADQTDLFDHSHAPGCIRAELHRCLAPCAARCTQTEYLARAELARQFLEGDADRPLGILRERMRLAAERLQFEYAATLRDRAARLEAVRTELLALRSSIDSRAVLYPVAGFGGEDRVYLIRRGAILAELDAPSTPAERARVAERIRSLLERTRPYTFQVDPRKVAEILLVARWFRLHPREQERVLPVENLEEALTIPS